MASHRIAVIRGDGIGIEVVIVAFHVVPSHFQDISPDVWMSFTLGLVGKLIAIILTPS